MPDKMLLIIINGERDKRYFKFFSSHRIVLQMSVTIYRLCVDGDMENMYVSPTDHMH